MTLEPLKLKMSRRIQKARLGEPQTRTSVVQSRPRIRAALDPAKPVLGYEAKVWLSLTGLAMLVAILWSYWPTLREMVHQWQTQPDYSHGFLVLPIAIFFLCYRRSSLPLSEMRPCWWGAVLLLTAVAARAAAGLYYLVPLDGWTLPLSIAGAVLLLFGRAVLWWSLPSIVFLWFMIPIPFSAERWLSVPLQAVATKLSTAALVFLGQPAIAEGNVILMGDTSLLVEEACSGMRIFVGIFALAFVFVLFSRWSWWLKMMMLVFALPIAIVTNAMRIVVTGLLYQWVSSEAGQKFSHDIAGFVMIPLAAGMFWLVSVYVDKLFLRFEDVDHPSKLYRGAAVASG
jgi:exosortase